MDKKELFPHPDIDPLKLAGASLICLLGALLQLAFWGAVALFVLRAL